MAPGPYSPRAREQAAKTLTMAEELIAVKEQRDRLLVELEEARDRHAVDINRIGNRMLLEAKKEDWCEEYDEIVEEVNHLLHFKLPLRARKFSVSVGVTVTVTEGSCARASEYVITKLDEWFKGAGLKAVVDPEDVEVTEDEDDDD